MFGIFHWARREGPLPWIRPLPVLDLDRLLPLWSARQDDIAIADAALKTAFEIN